jgi:hypothetical protein
LVGLVGEMVVPTYLGAMQLGGIQLGYSPLLMAGMGPALAINGLPDHSRYTKPVISRTVRKESEFSEIDF